MTTAGYSGTPLPHELGIAEGCAIDATWSALRLVWRRELR